MAFYDLEHGGVEQARACMEEALALNRQAGYKIGIAICLEALSRATMIQGDAAHAIRLADESLTLNREMGRRFGASVALQTLGAALHAHGETERAILAIKEGLVLVRDMGVKDQIPSYLQLLAQVYGAADPLRAARLLGSVDAATAEMDSPLPPDGGEQLTSTMAGAGVDNTAWIAAWNEGRAMLPDRAVAYALGEIDAFGHRRIEGMAT
jgi:tetratricopeptide (TPR) repeat protein